MRSETSLLLERPFLPFSGRRSGTCFGFTRTLRVTQDNDIRMYNI
jgi:hypothetical protein